jgi:succinate-acetate transporter protein
VAVPVLIFYGGMFQSFVGLFEMFLGNTFGGTVFCTYGAFNFSCECDSPVRQDVSN